LLIAFETTVTFVVLIVLAALASAWLWPIDLPPKYGTVDRMPRWLAPYHAVGSILVATALAWLRAAHVLSKHRERAARKSEIDRQRREAIESAKQRHQ